MNAIRLFNRAEIKYYPLKERFNKVDITTASVSPDYLTEKLPASLVKRVSSIADEILKAKKCGASVICAFGAHTIKNGLGKLLGDFVRRGWITHLATNGASVIHDWEFSFQGKSSEDVRANVQQGMFGTWEETGLYINLALAVGAYEGLGYGESVGSFIAHNGLLIPSREKLLEDISVSAEKRVLSEKLTKGAAACDLLELLDYLNIPSGFLSVEHAYSSYSAQAIAYESEIPFTSHPMFGHDIIYTHKASRGAIIGRTADKDFLSFVRSVSNLEGGVYLSVGSAVMSPMIFEKSLSMARNVEIQKGKDIRNCNIHVVDLQEETWDWNKGEPPMENPAYYLRFMKTFNRMGCMTDYISADNREFFIGLYQELAKRNTNDE